MKIKDIKAESEFYAIPDTWYQRTINLIHVAKDESEDSNRRFKAFYLWSIMLGRMNVLLSAIESSTKHRIPSYHKGTETNEPIIGLNEEDFKHNTLIDKEGYLCDPETKDFKDNGNGFYSITVKNIGRSDKTIK